MAWMQRLYDTYQHLSDSKNAEMNAKLLPVAHTPQTAHIEVTIDVQGNFIRAQALAPKTQITLPATEKSAGRSSGIAPHPFADKLQYCAPDYADFGGAKPSYFEEYFAQLSAWADSEYAHPAVVAVRDYLKKGKLVADLVAQNVCIVDEQNCLVHKVDAEEQPALFKALPKEKGSTEQGSALVCWRVERGSEANPNTWQDSELQSAWIAYDKANADSDVGFCLITGDQLPLATSHPAKLRHSGDKAKIISSNDSSGFTYRGRFDTPNQAVTISFDATQKAHNALRWLIEQPTSYRRDDQVVLAWSEGEPVETPLVPTEDLASMAMNESEFTIDFDEELATDIAPNNVAEVQTVTQEDSATSKAPSKRNLDDFGKAFAGILKKRLNGLNTKLRENDSDNIAIITLDSATPGRMAVTYYQELHVKEYLENIEDWYTCFAFHLRKSKEERQGEGPLTWITAPALYKIIEAAYGDITKSTSTLKKNLLSRLLPCIIEGQKFPQDIVQQAFYRAINRPAFGSEGWRWEEQLGVACALIRGEHIRRENLNKTDKYPQQYKGFLMALDTERKTRDYLFGRLLAVADNIEQYELRRMKEIRPSNAERLMQNFQQRPKSTWLTIEMQIRPYINRLKHQNEEKIQRFVSSRESLMDQIMSIVDGRDAPNDYWVDKPLGSEFLLGFHNQRHDLFKSKAKNLEQQAEENGATA